MKPKCDVAQGKAAPCRPGAGDPELVRLAGFASASTRYRISHARLERAERITRWCRFIAGEAPVLDRLVLLGNDLVTLSLGESTAYLDADLDRAVRLRGRYWRAEDEFLQLLGRLDLELRMILGLP